jgi:hypothetical protein
MSHSIGGAIGENCRPSQFSSGAYDPDLVRLMADALECAWRGVSLGPKDAELGRLVLAGAIIDCVDAGDRAHDVLVAKAKAALAIAARFSPGDVRFAPPRADL